MELIGKRFIIKKTEVLFLTCAVNSIPKIPWLAGAHKGSFRVFTSSVCMTVVLSCFTLIYICKKEVRHRIIKTDLVFLSKQFITVAYHNSHFMGSIFIFKTSGQSLNISPLKLIVISKGFALRLVLRQEL